MKKQRTRRPQSRVTESFLRSQKELNDRFHAVELERRCLLIEKAYSDLKASLVNLLTKEQVDAAVTCGMTPEQYALEWINLCSDKLRTYAPGYADHVGGIHTLKGVS